MSSVEELAVRVAVEKEQADRDRLAKLLRFAVEGQIKNHQNAELEDLAALDRYYFRGIAAGYQSVFARAGELYGSEFVEALLKDNP